MAVSDAVQSGDPFKANLSTMSTHRPELYKIVKDYAPNPVGRFFPTQTVPNLEFRCPDQSLVNAYGTTDPVSEIEALLEGFREANNQTFIFAGIGLGYFPLLAFQKIPEAKGIVILEPCLDLFVTVLHIVDLSELIPARISSKRLPRKNIKPLGGKPLLFWSIDVALEADIFHRVCVSTESEEIAQIVRGNYTALDVEVLQRPPALATDSASLNDVCKHFLENAPEVDVLSLMMPTYPFRKASRMIEEIVPPLYSGQIDLVNSVRHGNYSTFDYWIPNGSKFERMYTHIPLWCGAGNAAYAFQRREVTVLLTASSQIQHAVAICPSKNRRESYAEKCRPTNYST